MKKRNFGKVLSFCNVVRKKMGKKPVDKLKKGLPMVIGHCALSETIGGVLCYYNCVQFQNHFTHIPKPIEKFMRDFDHLKYPELVK